VTDLMNHTKFSVNEDESSVSTSCVFLYYYCLDLVSFLLWTVFALELFSMM
jgi:hypothetical protein